MGIVNLTPDSFSGDGCRASAAIDHARAQWLAGADIVDLGAESSRPGAPEISVDEELARLLPVLEDVVTWGVPVSVDTCKPEVMRAALEAGAAMINDIRALQVPGALEVVAASDAAVCLMHMQGAPRTMQHDPCYVDVVSEVADFLAGRVSAASAAGLEPQRIVVDPGFGFGKTLAHNLALMSALPLLASCGTLLAGLSRKSMLGALTGRPVEARQAASVAAALLAAERGASILRVHDVAATCDAMAILTALQAEDKEGIS